MIKTITQPVPASDSTPDHTRIVTSLDGITRRITYDAEGCVVSRTVVGEKPVEAVTD